MTPSFSKNLLLVLVFVLAGCTPTISSPTTTPTSTPTHVEEPTPTFEGIADCIWSGTAFVWIDQNGDGIFQEGEQPVPDVSVLIDDTLNGYTDVGKQAKTSLEGEAELSVWLPGCPDVEFEFYIQVPDGYVLTTAPRIKEGGADDRLSFGLTYLPGISTATPLPPSPVCNIYPFPRNRKFADFSIDNDGTIWVGTESNGVYSQLAGETEWTHWASSDYLISDSVWDVEENNGHVWVVAPSGASTFDGKTWQSYTDKDGLRGSVIYEVAVEKNGSAWFITDTGISFYSFDDKSWRSFPPVHDVSASFFDSIEITSDGTVWFTTDNLNILRLRWPDHKGDPEWLIYSTRPIEKDAIDVEYLPTWNFAADNFGNIWFVGFGGFTQYNVFQDTWSPQYFGTDLYYLEKEFWHVTPDIDGSVWITGQSRLYHYFPAGTKSDKDVMLEYSTSGSVPDISSLLAMEVGPDGKVWFLLERQIYQCEFFD